MFKDKLWFFLAGRDRKTRPPRSDPHQHRVPHADRRAALRGQADLLAQPPTTGSSAPTSNDNRTGPTTIRRHAHHGRCGRLYNRELPRDCTRSTTPASSPTTSSSRRSTRAEFQFSAPARPQGRPDQRHPARSYSQRPYYWSPTSSAACASPRTATTRITSPRSRTSSPPAALGTHDIVVGSTTSTTCARPTTTSRAATTGSSAPARSSAAANISPVFDGNTVIHFNPIFQETQGTSFKTNSFFVNDSWRFNDKPELQPRRPLRPERRQERPGRKCRQATRIFSPRVARPGIRRLTAAGL